MTDAPHAIIIGAGITGLSAGFRLHEAGWRVTVLEAGDHVGGRMSSVEVDGFICNRAANILPGSYDAIRQLAADVGIGDQLGVTDGIIATLRDGHVHRLRSDKLVRDVLRTRLVPWRTKVRAIPILIDALRMRGSLSYENLGSAADFDVETVAEYCARRLTPELREYVVEPVVRALFVSEAERLSVVDFFFAAVNFIGSGFMQYPGGIGFLAEALAATLNVRLECRVENVSRTGEGAQVTWEHNGTQEVAVADAAVIATVGAVVPELYPDLDPRASEILRRDLEYASVFNAHFGLDGRPEEPASIIQVPRAEDEALCVVTLDHNASPSIVPPGKGKLATYWHHHWCSSRMDREDGDLLAEMLPSVRKVVPDVEALTVTSRIDRWPRGVVRSRPGTYALMRELGSRIDARSPIQLAGDYFSASSTNGCAVSGKLAAERLLGIRSDLQPA
ncbi:protoporphyrinogen/coproporphyrinogen oxidase [Candidatus Poriferisocius sp.]|uniref:protoporphyrinogen/coproporphyrinogen oxidase n=1 Tax=Candidatus Poriferisocius sp. TaxID=3101276 RepID=UPI003B01544A